MATLAAVVSGPPLPALDRLRIMSPGQWTDFVHEWAHSLKSDYASVERVDGAGDMGCDVVGFVTADRGGEWDNFQCKHYDHALTPTDVWLELGKLCFYTFKGEYSVPRRYSFISPQGAGNRLSSLLTKPERLRSELKANWNQYCRTAITSTRAINLTGRLLSHVDGFKFGIVNALSPLTLIDQHRKTPWHIARFGGGLPARPPVAAPPPGVDPAEATYVRALLDAYEERQGSPIAAPDAINVTSLRGHFTRARREFYSAEALRGFSRENVPIGTFDSLLTEVHDGVADVVDAAHSDAVERVLATERQAKVLQLTVNPLVAVVTTTDRGGMCHVLANEERLKWKR